MSHKDVLKLLFPLEIGGVFDSDVSIEGKHLDDAETSGAALLNEAFADQTSALISEWERVYGIVPSATSTIQYRRNAVIQKMRTLGRLDIQFFIGLAAAVGYTVNIEEVVPNDTGYGYESIWIWRVHVPIGSKPLYYFRAGQSRAGDPLLTWDKANVLEGIINEFKPAHTQVYFVYE